MYPPIFATCAGNTAVTDLLGAAPTRLFPFGEAPENVALPYATWQGIGGQPENFLGDRPDMDSFSIQVDVYANNDVTAYATAEALRNAIEGHAYVTAWRGDGRDPDTNHYRYSFDVEWHVSR